MIGLKFGGIGVFRKRIVKQFCRLLELSDSIEITLPHAQQNDNNFQGFRDSWYTLISGTADDNVHFMSPAHIEKKLVAADVDFDNFFYGFWGSKNYYDKNEF